MNTAKATIEQFTVTRKLEVIAISGHVSVKTRRQKDREMHPVKGCYMTKSLGFALYAFRSQCRAMGKSLQKLPGSHSVKKDKHPRGLLWT